MKYLKHKQKWEDCDLCPLHKTRYKTVIARGQVPCDILFIGEAPGPSEDTLGKPFVGPAGKLLDEMIKLSLKQLGNPEVRLAFTNLVCCTPLEEGSDKFKEPPEESIKKCSPRLQEFIDKIAKPKGVVFVGECSQKYIVKKEVIELGEEVASVKIVHPAAILRGSPAAYNITTQHSVVILRDFIYDVLELAHV